MNTRSIKAVSGLALVFFMASCDHFEKVKKSTIVVADSSTQKMEEKKSYDVALVDNRKDPTCGMPVTAGINDTAHYKTKVIGFCSAECKAEFVKNPEAGLVAAELKK